MVNTQPSACDRSLTQTALAALMALLLVAGLSAQSAASSEPLVPLVDDGGPGGISARERVNDARYPQQIEVHHGSQPSDATSLAADDKAMLPCARTEGMPMRGSLTFVKHPDDEVYCYFCFSYR